MNLETIIVSGITAFLGAMAAITFQYLREHNEKQERKISLLKQTISLVQHQRIVVEAFYKNATKHIDGDRFHIPNVAPKALITSTISTQLAGYLTKKNYEVFILVQTTYNGFEDHANSLRERYFEHESRSLGQGRPMNPVEIETLNNWLSNYIQILENTILSHQKVQRLLNGSLNDTERQIFGSPSGMSFKFAAFSIYILLVTVLAVCFFIMWKINV